MSEIVAADYTVYLWGEEAKACQPNAENYVLVFKRRVVECR